MNSLSLTPFRASLLGCGLAIAGCLLSPRVGSQVSTCGNLELPSKLGTWELESEGTLSDETLGLLQANSHWRRTYRCSTSGEVLVATLVVGAAGPLTSHRPEVCYARDEFSAPSRGRRWKLPEGDDAFRIQTLESRDPAQPALTLAYAWHNGERWVVPWAPRVQLTGIPQLQRLQIAIRHPRGMEREGERTLKQFVQLAVNAAERSPRVGARSAPAEITY